MRKLFLSNWIENKYDIVYILLIQYKIILIFGVKEIKLLSEFKIKLHAFILNYIYRHL